MNKLKILRLIASTMLFWIAEVSTAQATPIFYVGRVLEDTPQMTPVSNATVNVTFYVSSEQGGGLIIPNVDTDSNGYFWVKGDVTDLTLYDKADIIILPTSKTEMLRFQADITPVINIDVTAISIEIIAAKIGIPVGTLLSTDFIAQGGAGVFKVCQKTLGVTSCPEPSILYLMIIGISTFGFARKSSSVNLIWRH